MAITKPFSVSGGSSVSSDADANYFTGRDADNNFTLGQLTGTNYVDGQGGTDTLTLNEPAANYGISGPGGNGVVTVSKTGAVFYLTSVEKIAFSNGTFNTADLLNPPAPVVGTDGNDLLIGTAGSESIDGGAGIDTLQMNGVARAAATIQSNGNHQWSIGCNGTGNDTLSNVERITFSDAKLALDVGADGNAGQALELIGVLRPDLLNSHSIRGEIISLFDQGFNMTQLCEIALNANLLPHANAAELAQVVYQHVIGGQASDSMMAELTGYIDAHGQVDFLAVVAGLHHNANIDLVGIAATGIEFA